MTALNVDVGVEFGVKVRVEPITRAEITQYVITKPEIVRARAVLAESYRLLTDFVTPMCVLRQIAPQIDALEAWIGSEAHCASH
jgi:hypothetical protein